MKRFTVLFLYGLFIVCTLCRAQTTQTVRGQVVDKETQIPLIGVTLQIPGTHSGTTTDGNGYFRFSKIPIGRITLQVSYLGYEPQ